MFPLLSITTALISTLSHTKAQFKGCTPASLCSPCSVCSFTPPHGLTKKMMVEDGWRLPLSLTLIQCQCSARVCVCVGGLSGSLLGENRGLQWSRTGGPYISVIVPPFLLSLPMINQIHRPLRSAVSCYLVTMICLGRLCFHGDCAHPVISLAVLSQWPVATPGPDPQLPASLPHGPVRLSVCVHVAVQPLTVPGW